MHGDRPGGALGKPGERPFKPVRKVRRTQHLDQRAEFALCARDQFSGPRRRARLQRQFGGEKELRHRVVHLGGEPPPLLQGCQVPRRLGAGREQRRALERGAELPTDSGQKGERLSAEGLRAGRGQVEDADRPRAAQHRDAGVQLEPRLVARGGLQTAAPHDVHARVQTPLTQQPLTVAAAGTEWTVVMLTQSRGQARRGGHRELTLMQVALHDLRHKHPARAERQQLDEFLQRDT